MHQNVCRMNYFNVLCMNYQFEKFQFFDWKWPIIFISAQNASVRIRMHQNACRMNCANVLCRKISKKWFLLHLNRLKLKNYLYLFVMEDPVGYWIHFARKTDLISTIYLVFTFRTEKSFNEATYKTYKNRYIK